MPSEIRSKFWLFTWNNYASTPGYPELLSGFKNLTYLVYGYETAPVTGTPHLQGYLEFGIRTKLSTLKKLQAQIHWEVPKHYSTWQECKGYCVKEGGDVFEWGTGVFDKVKSKRSQGHATGGKRTDIDDVRDALLTGVINNTRELELWPGLTYQGMLFADRFLRNARPERDGPPDVFVLHGSTGIGKSRFAHEFIERIERGRGWRSWQSYDNKLKWFDGYDKHEIALFDDFRGGDCHFPTLLRICDRYVCRVEVKGASAWWCPKIIIFTTSQSLESGFGHLGQSDRAEQFFRRVRAEGHGGEFNFNDPVQLALFRDRIDGYAVPVSEVPEIPSPIPQISFGTPEVEEGAEESKSYEVVCDGSMSSLWGGGIGLPVYGDMNDVDINSSFSSIFKV